jgi:hypothetical protein
VTQDPKSIGGKYARPAGQTELLVIGAGPAGIAAAIEGARAGAKVMLVDENPVAGALIGLDVPLLFGGRMAGAGGSKERFTEAVAASIPGLEEAFDRGVDVRLGTYAWGAFVNGPALASLPGNVAGIADEAASSMIGFEKLIIATGARDLCFFFPGSHLPGVVGANGLAAMLGKYRAFNGRRILILGSGSLARASADLAIAHGLEVAGFVEVRAEAQAEPGPFPLFASHVLLRAEGDLSGVRAAVLAPVGGGPDGRPEIHVACDTICLAIGRVPNIELLDVLGARLVARPERGGFVPEGAPPATSLPDIFVAGDVAGLGPVQDASFARDSGRLAARAARGLSEAVITYPPPADCQAYPREWMRALVAAGGLGVMACQCEEVTRADLLGVQPPRYLGPRPPAMTARDLATLLADGPVNQDQIKRLTRAGMGSCQGRRCREQVALLLALGSNAETGAIALPSWRAPVRPLPLSVLAASDETQEMRRHWDAWFGISTQWTPYADIGTEREAYVSDFGLGEKEPE